MQINNTKPGDTFEISGIDEKTKEPVTIKFEIVEVSWFPSTVKQGVLFHGAKVKTEEGKETIIDFITLECSKKI